MQGTLRNMVGRFARVLAGMLIWVALVLVRATWRVRIAGAMPQSPALLAFWHGDLLALSCALGRGREAPTVLASRSRDGQIGSVVATALGLEVVRGSSSKGAVAAGHALMRCLLAGRSVGVAVDGPRGPAQRTSDAALSLAAAAGAPVVPVVATGRRLIRLRTWDRFAIPAPFTRVVVVWGDPVEDSLEQQLLRLGDRATGLATMHTGQWRLRHARTGRNT